MRPRSISPTRVHTDVGNHAVAARVDKKLVPLRTKLASGQTVEIITAPVGGAEAAMAGVRGHRQGAHRDPPPAQAPASTRTRCSSAIACSTARWKRSAPRSIGCRAQRAGRLPRRAPLSAAGGAAGRHRARQPHARAGRAGRWRAAAPETARPARSRGRRAAARQILITGAERGVITLRQLLHCRSRATRSWATTPPARASSCIGMDCPNVADYRKSPERWVADRLGSRGRRRFPGRAADRGRQPARACWRRSRRRSRRPNRTSTASNTWSATRSIAAIRFAIEVRDRKHLADVIRRVRRLAVVHGVQRL